MSEKVKRSWGKGRQREEVTIINREKIEETLQTLVEEAKKCKTASNSSNKATTGTRTDEMDLQYPELMSDESLVTALKRIKVPIPVYPNGRPSRERLLHLYRTNILPRPQRNRRKRRRVSGVSQEDDQGGSAMEVEVEYHSEWDANSSESSNTQLQRKRKCPGVGSTEQEEGISPAKKLSIDPSVSTLNIAPPTPSPTHTLGALKLDDGGMSTPVHRVVRLKRPTDPSPCATLLKRPAGPSASDTPALIANTTGTCSAESVNTICADTAQKVCRAKIMWP